MDDQLSGSHNSCQHNVVAYTPLGMSHQHVSFHPALYQVIPANIWSQYSQYRLISQVFENAMDPLPRKKQITENNKVAIYIRLYHHRLPIQSIKKFDSDTMNFK